MNRPDPMIRRVCLSYLRALRRLLPDRITIRYGPEIEREHEALLRRGEREGLIALIGVLLRATGDTLRVALSKERGRGSNERSEKMRLVTRMWDALSRNLALAFRGIRRRPGPALVAVVTVGIGVGATTATSNVAYEVLVRDLPYESPDELVRGFVSMPSINQPHLALSWGQYSLLQDRNRAFTAMASFTTGRTGTFDGGGDPVQIRYASVTHTFLPTLGVTPHIGRGILASEDRAETETVGLVDYDFWQSAFAGDPTLLGSTVTLNATPVTIVGVLPAGFRMPHEFGLEAPSELLVQMGRDFTEQPFAGSQNFHFIGRLAEGATLGTADANLQELMDFVQAETGFDPGLAGFAEPLGDEVWGTVRSSVLMLQATALMVLLLVGVNLANLLLARGLGRFQELSTRRALGARRRELVALLLSESVLLSVLGSVAALAIALGLTRFLVSTTPVGVIPRMEEVSVTPMVFLASLMLAVGVGLLFGLVPGLRATRTVQDGGVASAGRGRIGGVGANRLRRALIASQVALATLLTVTAGLMLRTIGNLNRVDPGLSTAGLMTAEVRLPFVAYREIERVNEFFDRLVSEADALPGVEAAGLISRPPVSGRGLGDTTFYLLGPGRTPEERRASGAHTVVSTDYFGTAGIAVTSGRNFTVADRDTTNLVVMINRAMVDRYYPDEDPVGQDVGLLLGDTTAFEVVGVVENVQNLGLARESMPEVIFEYHQATAKGLAGRIGHLTVRTSAPAAEVSRALKQVLNRLDPTIALGPVQAVDDVLDRTIARESLLVRLLSIFSLIGIVVAAVGVWSVLSSYVAERKREIGLRMALGATGRNIRREVLAGGLIAAAVGLGVGSVLSLTAGGLLRSLLFGIAPHDPLTHGGVIGVMLVVAALAGLIPAQQAASNSPTEALREG